MADTFMTPEGHTKFLAKKLFDWQQEGPTGKLHVKRG